MKKFISIMMAFLLLFSISSLADGFSTDPIAMNEACLSVVKLELFDENDELIGTGSGFVAFSNDLIVTNCHVIAEAKKIIAYSDVGESYVVSDVLCVNSDKDIAILSFESPTDLAPLPLNETGDVLRAAPAVAIGSPMGFHNTVSKGNVSSVFTEEEVRYIQFTAPVSPGSSGGALINDDGAVIGITTATFYDADGAAQNLNFAVNIIEVIELYEQHKEDEKTPLADWKDINTGVNEINFASANTNSFTLRNYAGFSISEVYLYPDGAASWGKARNTAGWLNKNSSLEVEVTDEEKTLNTTFTLNFCFYLSGRAYYMDYTGLSLRDILGRTITIYMDNGTTIRVEVE
ncbi:MAG: serine protease [Clostridia bacterium]|nr:serine protease [Clostridiales bacterium]MBQ3232440.1 serine protease [Clostridia bacterium]